MATATKTRKPRSAFQAADDFGSVLLTYNGTTLAPEQKIEYLNTAYVEYVNPERTIAVVSNGRGYAVVAKTGLRIEDVFTKHADVMKMGHEHYVGLRGRGIWAVVQDSIGAKTNARNYAEDFASRVQDITDPFTVTIDGSHAPALTIARTKWECQNEYTSERSIDGKRLSAVHDIAQAAQVPALLLALALKEDRLIWSTPPVAPKSVVVVVKDSTTGVLSERLVDEIVLATGEIDGLGRIVHTGSVPEYLLARRERSMGFDVQEILESRDQVEKTLQEVQERVDSLKADLAKGYVLGHGFHDTIRLAQLAEAAQQAATRYAAVVRSADLPEEFALSLRTGTYKDTGRYSMGRSDIRGACKALSALNGMQDPERY